MKSFTECMSCGNYILCDSLFICPRKRRKIPAQSGGGAGSYEFQRRRCRSCSGAGGAWRFCRSHNRAAKPWTDAGETYERTPDHQIPRQKAAQEWRCPVRWLPTARPKPDGRKCRIWPLGDRVKLKASWPPLFRSQRSNRWRRRQYNPCGITGCCHFKA